MINPGCDSCQDHPSLGQAPRKCGGMTPQILKFDMPGEITIFHKAVVPASEGDDTVIIPENGLYRNVLLEYEANGHVYLYSSDGIPTLLNSGLTSFNDLSDRPRYGGTEMTSNTDIPDLTGDVSTLQSDLQDEIYNRIDADTAIADDLAQEILDREAADSELAGDIGAEEAARIAADDGKVDKVVGKGLSSNDYTNEDAATVANLDRAFVTGGSVSTDTSTVTITHSKYDPATSDGSSEALAMPVANATNAGVMNANMYNQLQANASQINSILNGAVSVSGLSANPSQSDLTAAWETETGLSEVINGAKINDPDNQKVWTYYTNTQQWYAATNTAQVTISQWTNSAQGVILGSTSDGQLFAENDGTGSVNGWDALKGRVSTLESNEVSISVTNSDPGEGATLAANHFIAVY